MIKTQSRSVTYPIITALSFFALATVIASATPECNCFYGRWGAHVAYILAEIAIIKLIVINLFVDKSNIRHKSYVLWVLFFVAFILYLIFFLLIVRLGERYALGGPY